MGLHSIASSLSGIREIEIDRPEANKLATALAEVNSFYEKSIDPKLFAWMGVVAACGEVYGPRVMAYRLNRASEKAAPKVAGLQSSQVPAVTPAQRSATVTPLMRAVADPEFVNPVS